jgi:uncharacterized protein YyaL (SSP411 family)
VKTPQGLAEDCASEQPAVGRLARRQDVENCRRRNRAECDQAANPDYQYQECGVPQREHLVIIIDALDRPPIAWLPWSADAFARAAREQKPVLLSITAAWCRACHEMDRVTYGDPRVAPLVHERFVPVRVDTDRRPDINERYNLGGWPTTAFLTANGDLIGGGMFIAAERMPGILLRVAEAFASRAEEIAQARIANRAPSAPSVSIETGTLIETIFSTFDEEFGGFGIEPKFPHTAPLHLAMALYRDTGNGRWRRIVERTLDAMVDGELWDRQAGGFCRYATTRDWQQPHEEKLLETNALLLRAYAEAALVFNRTVDRERCREIVSFLTTRLRSDQGGYHGSDADHVLYADANAAAASALLAAAAALEEEDLAREALASLERVVLACYKPGLGVAHYFDGSAQVRGLLVDHVSMIGALLDAHAVSDGEPYRMMAEELVHYMARETWDAAEGGFFDRAGMADDIGLLRTRRKPFVANADAAIVCERLHRAGHEFDLRQYAAGALEAAARQAAGQGPLAAHYVLAERHLASR